jgi:glucose-1-phosphate adenylyltransferase
MDGCRVDRAMVAEGCRIRDAQIERSIVGVRSIVEPGVRIRNSVIMGADLYESAADLERNASLGIPNVGIGAGSTIDRAIVDKNARIGERVVIANEEGVRERDGSEFYIRDGIVVIPKGATIPAGTRI